MRLKRMRRVSDEMNDTKIISYSATLAHAVAATSSCHLRRIT